MSLYSKLTETNIRKIIQNYPIGELLNWKLLTGGSENTNYYLNTSKGNFVLTLCEQKTAKEAQILTNLLRHLEEYKFTTSKVFNTNSGANLSSFNEKPIILKWYLEGKIIKNFEESLLEKVGKSIAQLNQIPSPNFLPNQFSYGQDQFSTIYHLAHPFVDWLKKTHNYIAKYLDEDLPKSLIHGDIFTSNVVVNDSNNPIIMDFEEACYYYRLFDIGMACVGLCCTNGRLIESKIKQLIKGYELIQPLTNSEKEKVPVFIVYAASATAFWRFRQFNIISPKTELFEHYKAMQLIANQVLIEGFVIE